MKYSDSRVDIIRDCLLCGGSKQEAAAKAGITLATFYNWAKCHSAFREMLEDVDASVCVDHANNYKHHEELHRKRQKQKGVGYVYLLHCQGTEYFKIGISKSSPMKRLSAIQSGCPLEINMVHTSYCNHYSLVESILHDLYASRHVRGEWFDMTGVDVQEIVDAMDTYATAQIGLF